MPFAVACPHCNQNVPADKRLEGQLVKCPVCQAPFVMPVLPVPAAVQPTRLEPPVARPTKAKPPIFKVTELELPPVAPPAQPSAVRSTRLERPVVEAYADLPLDAEQTEAPSVRALFNKVKRFASLPWLVTVVVMGFLPWSEVACNSKEMSYRVSQSGYQAVYGGVSSPFDIVELTKKESEDKAVTNNPEAQAIAKSIETERSGFLMTCSPFAMVFWALGFAVLTFVLLVPLGAVRMRSCVALAGAMMLMLVLQAIFGTPMERRVIHGVHEAVKENPKAALQYAMAVTSGKTAWFWVTMVAVALVGLSESVTNYLWRSFEAVSFAVTGGILGSTAVAIAGGIGLQVLVWQAGIVGLESKLADYRKKERQKVEDARTYALAEQRRREQEREEREKAAQEREKERQRILKEQEVEEERRRAARQVERERQQKLEREEAERRRLEAERLERERAVREEVARKERERLDNLGEKDITEIRSLLVSKSNPGSVATGLKAVTRLGPKAVEALPEVLMLLKASTAKAQEPILDALRAMGSAATADLLRQLKAATAQERRLELAIWLAVIDVKDAKVTDAIVPVLVGSLRPLTNQETPNPEVLKSIGTIGQPAVDEIYYALGKADDRGVINANNRKALFQAMEQIGSKGDVEKNLERLRKYISGHSEQYPDVRQAREKALNAMRR